MSSRRDHHDPLSHDPRDWLNLAFPGDSISVRSALMAVRGALSQMDMPGEISGVVEIVLGEVLNNVVEHAYDGRSPEMITLKLERQETGLAFEVRDTGRPMPHGVMPEGHPNDLDVPSERLPEGGFGWHMIRTLTVALSYERKTGQNTLRFTIPFSGRPALH